MKNKVLKICQDICCEEVSLDEELIVSGILNSYRIMELICGLEEEFNIVFEAEEISELDNFSCINQIIKIIEEKIK